jgi:hypothetical protein
MIGRGIDQILPHPSTPQIHEGYLKGARAILSWPKRPAARFPEKSTSSTPGATHFRSGRGMRRSCASSTWRPTQEEVHFAHHLIEVGVDLVHGHSSHHIKAIEVYRGRLVLYGCGDLINDYEGISGFERYRGELGLMYFARMRPATGDLSTLTMVPTRVQKFRLQRATAEECAWLKETLNREGERFATRVQLARDGSLTLCLPRPISRYAAF